MLEIIGLSCLTVLLVNATPILMLRDKVGLLDMKESYSMFRNRIIELLSCPMCLGFWIGFLYFITTQNNFFQSILLGSIISILSEIINKYIRK